MKSFLRFPLHHRFLSWPIFGYNLKLNLTVVIKIGALLILCRGFFRYEILRFMLSMILKLACFSLSFRLCKYAGFDVRLCNKFLL